VGLRAALDFGRTETFRTPDSSASSLVAIPNILAGLEVSTILSPVKIITADIRVKNKDRTRTRYDKMKSIG
jgi:hypothetical protein